MLDQETIRTFIKVAEYSSFSQAAKSLHKTPAAISYRIKMLEDNLGIALFNRTTRTVSLTLAGHHLFERCHQWMSWLNTMPDELQQISGGIEREISISINNLLYNANAVAQLLAHLKAQFPFTRFKLTRQVYMGVWDSLLYSDIQLAIGATGWDSLDNGVNILPFGEVSWVFVAASSHPLAQLQRRLTDEDLRPYSAINIEDTAQNLTKRVAWLLPGQTEIRVPDIHTKLACHLKGLGIGFLPKKICQPYLDNGQLVQCDVINHRKPSPLSLAWKTGEVGKATQEIISLFHRNSPIIQDFLVHIDQPVHKNGREGNQ